MKKNDIACRLKITQNVLLNNRVTENRLIVRFFLTNRTTVLYKLTDLSLELGYLYRKEELNAGDFSLPSSIRTVSLPNLRSNFS